MVGMLRSDHILRGSMLETLRRYGDWNTPAETMTSFRASRVESLGLEFEDAYEADSNILHNSAVEDRLLS